MKKISITKLIIENICLLIPLIIYGIYKNGYLIYQKGLINIISILKPLYLVVISIIIKILIDIIKYKKIKIDYNLVYVILISMIMPYNVNLLFYALVFTILYAITMYLEEKLKINKVCLIYLIIIGIHFMFNKFTYLSPLEENYQFSFGFLDFLMGRNIGSISTTSIFFSFLAYIYLISNYYYKKDIPFIINISYLVPTFIYFIITNDSSLLLNSELIFASIFICAIPKYSPYKINIQLIYSIFIGVLSFVVSLLFNRIIAVYIVTLIASILLVFINRQNQLFRNKK